MKAMSHNINNTVRNGYADWPDNIVTACARQVTFRRVASMKVKAIANINHTSVALLVLLITVCFISADLS